MSTETILLIVVLPLLFGGAAGTIGLGESNNDN
jgi:hypothetical protein